jgi:GTPase Era involved in 16S rRNA processing
MSSQQFQETYINIFQISKNLLKFLQEYRKGKLSEGDNTRGLESVEKTIQSVITGLSEQKYEVAIVAPMKAGKSTFLNAIIGADILASESAACTICRTDVRHIKADEKPRLLEYHDGERKPLVIAEGNAHEIQEKFLKRTREVRSQSGNLPTRFEILYPIEAIQNLPALSGFTLIDTPGPNEWKSMSVDTVALKQVSLEALRTCKAVLFILNYRSFKDKAVDELFQSITENRQELLANNQSRIFFILNQIDLKSEKDPEISETVDLLKKDLTGFGFPDPVVFPVSALQGLLAKMINRGTATEEQIKDFKKFFSARYARENEEGDMIIPSPKRIALQAIRDSGILEIQEAVFSTVVQTSGWILLNDSLSVLSGSAKAIEDTLNTQIAGWEMEIDSLRNKIEEYQHRAKTAKEKVDSVRRSIDRQKDILLEGFSAGVDAFTEGAKEKIDEEINNIAQSRSEEQLAKKQLSRTQSRWNSEDENIFNSLFKIGTDIVGDFLELIPVVGKTLSKTFKVASPLLDNLRTSTPQVFTTQYHESFNPYIIRCNSQTEAEKVREVINDFCSPHLQSWWLDTQDRLIRQGTTIREELVKVIQDDIQVISDELSEYLGDALQVEININTIQFPSFEFEGIDAQVKHQQEVFQRSRREQKRESRCCKSDRVYDVDVPVTETRSFYEIDLKDTAIKIKAKLDEQSAMNKALLERVIKKQVDEDFRKAEKQILDYIEKFQTEFDRLLSKRVQYESEAPQVIEALKQYDRDLQIHLQALQSLKNSLMDWKPE